MTDWQTATVRTILKTSSDNRPKLGALTGGRAFGRVHHNKMKANGMKNLADFKRELQKHPFWLFSFINENGEPSSPQRRTVLSIHNTHVIFMMPDKGGATTRLDFPPSKTCFFPNSDTFKICRDKNSLNALTYTKRV